MRIQIGDTWTDPVHYKAVCQAIKELGHSPVRRAPDIVILEASEHNLVEATRRIKELSQRILMLGVYDSQINPEHERALRTDEQIFFLFTKLTKLQADLDAFLREI